MRPTARSLTFFVPVITALTLVACSKSPYYDKQDDRPIAEGIYRPAAALQEDRSYETLTYDQFEVKNGLLIASRLNESTLKVDTATVGVLSRSSTMAWEVNPQKELGQEAINKPGMAEMLNWFAAGSRLRLIFKDGGMQLTRSRNGQRDQISLKRLTTESAQGQLGKVTGGHELLAKLRGIFAETLKKETMTLKEQTVTVTENGREKSFETVPQDKFKDEIPDGDKTLVRIKTIQIVDESNFIANGKYPGTMKYRLLKASPGGAPEQRLAVEIAPTVDAKTQRAEKFLGAFSKLDNGGFTLTFEEAQGRGNKRVVRRTYVPQSRLRTTTPPASGSAGAGTDDGGGDAGAGTGSGTGPATSPNAGAPISVR